MRRVNPKVYTKDYYLTDCTGYLEFIRTYGEKLEPRFKEILPSVVIKKNTNVLDIGCGRGELIYYISKMGANGYGIDYSSSAIKLANALKSKKEQRYKEKMHFLVMDAKALQFKDSFFDSVIMTDVVEHLYPEELDIVIKEVKRVLKPNGELIIHTAPNRWFNDFGYKYYSYPLSSAILFFWNNILKRNYPNIAKPEVLRTDSHAIMHINEPTYFSLRKLFNKFNFKGQLISTNITARKEKISIKDTVFNAIVFLDPISRKYPLNIFWGSDFFAVLKNKK